MMKPNYSVGYTLNDDLQVEPEVRIFVDDYNHNNAPRLTWLERNPDHRYNEFIQTSHGNTWHSSAYFDLK